MEKANVRERVYMGLTIEIETIYLRDITYITELIENSVC